MHPRLYRPRRALVTRLQRATIAERIAAVLLRKHHEPSGPRETFLRLREEEARQAVRHPGRKRR
jgi:hypothetical protein